MLVWGHMVERFSNHPVVNVYIPANLQHRRASISTGQRLDVRLRCDHGHFNALPDQTLATQHFLGLLRKGRDIVMMQDDGAVTHQWHLLSNWMNTDSGAHRRQDLANGEPKNLSQMHINR